MLAMTSKYLTQQKTVVKELVDRLSKKFEFVSVLGVDTNGKNFRVNRSGTSIEDSMWTERGFLVRVYQNEMYSEYAFNEISTEKLDSIEKEIILKTQVPENVKNSSYVKLIKYPLLEEEEVVGSFIKNKNIKTEKLDHQLIVDKLNKIKDDAFKKSDLLVNVIVGFEQVNISKIYISNKKNLEQSYTWGNAVLVPIARKGQESKYFYEGFSSLNPMELLTQLDSNYEEVVNKSLSLLDAEKVTPGVYDIICAPDITGLIAHEAFGHGVEMDMFVKNRAKAVEYIEKSVASELVTMHDGAASAEEVSSYGFDDEGVLAQDTVVIDKGILKTGISDVISALRLNKEPSGNGKRQSYHRKAYSRMTNTFFDGGEDKLEDMIKSIESGYLITGMMSGMEDPKNWGIQCVAMVGEEIKDGKLTGKCVSPVIMTGYVPDLLKSISMMSEKVELFGTGVCGKGHKELVKASDGGPYIKARVRLG